MSSVSADTKTSCFRHDLVLVGIDRLAEGIVRPLGEGARRDEDVEVSAYLPRMSWSPCTAVGAIVIGDERAAIHLGPAILALERFARRGGAGAAAQSIANALQPFVMVGR